jgi:hypothetical protein
MGSIRTYRHIRYASAARGQEPQLADYKPSPEGSPCACPQNKFRLDFVMGAAAPLLQSEDMERESFYWQFNLSKDKKGDLL